MRIPLTLFVLVLSFSCAAGQAGSGRQIFGNWREPGGSVIEVAPCGPNICARLVKVVYSVNNPTDKNNPNASLRSRPVCGLLIGTGFHLDDSTHAEGGKLYDPKSGKTYHGAMTAQGNQLSLRGYVGFKAFGRTEVWTRVPPVSAPCAA